AARGRGGPRGATRLVGRTSLRLACAGVLAQADDGDGAVRRVGADVRAQPMTSPRSSASRLGDQRMEDAIGRILRIGVTVSSVALALGLVLRLTKGDSRPADLLLHGGLIILMATPVGRVVISVVEYVLERDWFFVLMTSIVLLELMASVVAAMR